MIARLITVSAAAAALAATSILTAAPAFRGVDVHEVDVVASKFAFEPAVIHVTAGEQVRLLIHSADVLHGFAIRKLNIDVEVPGGSDPVIVELTAPPAGRYEIACSEFCGSGHGRMKAALERVAAPLAGR